MLEPYVWRWYAAKETPQIRRTVPLLPCLRNLLFTHQLILKVRALDHEEIIVVRCVLYLDQQDERFQR